MKKFIVILVAGVLALAMPVSATIINIPDDYETIQEGIDASSDGDTVLVQPGTYVENINFNGHNIILGSLFLTTGDISYISQTIIYGNQSGSVVTFENGEDFTAVVTGFRIQNGYGFDGGGIHCYDSSPTISNNTINGNIAYIGGGIHCGNSNPAISYNTISGNVATFTSGGILCEENSNPTISNNTISGNSARRSGGGIDMWNSNPTISYNIITDNSANEADGGGIRCVYSNPTIIYNTISGNSATEGYGGGIYCHNSSPTITNTIFWGDIAQNGREISLYGTSSPVITYCDILGGWEGEGNIDANPLFRDPENDDFHLQSITNPDCGGPGDSPCIDAGDPDLADLILSCDWGLGEMRSDMGAYGGAVPIDEIPTLSEWSMLIMALLLLAVGTIAIIRSRQLVAEGPA